MLSIWRGIGTVAVAGLALALAAGVSAGASTGDAVLNEVLANPAGTDTGYEYFEVRGVPGSTLQNTYLLFVDGNGNKAGSVEVAISLGGQTLGSNGLLFITSSSNPLGVMSPTTVLATSTLSSPGGSLQNATATTLLVRSTVPIVAGTDLDADNNGTLEGLPAGALVLDAVGWSDGGSSDRVYGPVLTQVSSNPDAATRFRHDLTRNSAAAWYCGAVWNPGHNDPSSTQYDPANVSTNAPGGGRLTPGTPNAPGSNRAPTATADRYRVDYGSQLSVGSTAGVLANDVDADGDVLAAVLVSPPRYGQLSLHPDGSFVYKHTGAGLTDSFTYRATDCEDVSSIQTVTLFIGPDVLSVEASPYLIIGGLQSMVVRVNLDGPAPPGGLLVSLQNTNPALNCPTELLVPEGETAGEVTADGDVVPLRVYGRVYATRGGASPYRSVSVRPVLPRTLTISQNPTLGGNTVVGTATLEAPATAGGVLLTLVSSDPRVTFDTPSVRVPEGETEASFNLHTELTNADYKALVEARYGGQSAKRTLHVRANGVSEFTIAPDSVPGGTAAVGTVVLHLPAPPGGRLVSFVSSNSLRARVQPSSLTILEGQTTATVNVVTFAGPPTGVTITARALTESRSAGINLTP